MTKYAQVDAIAMLEMLKENGEEFLLPTCNTFCRLHIRYMLSDVRGGMMYNGILKV